MAAVRPYAPGARERELKALIESIHPEAAFRSFARDVATALGPQHLVVAHYVGAGDQALPEPAAEQPTAQGELFAA